MNHINILFFFRSLSHSFAGGVPKRTEMCLALWVGRFWQWQSMKKEQNVEKSVIFGTSLQIETQKHIKMQTP